MLLVTWTWLDLVKRLRNNFPANLLVNIPLSCQRIRASRTRLWSLRLFTAKILFGSFVFSFSLAWKYRPSVQLWFFIYQIWNIFEFVFIAIKFFDTFIKVWTIQICWIESWWVWYRSIVFRVVGLSVKLGLFVPLKPF